MRAVSEKSGHRLPPGVRGVTALVLATLGSGCSLALDPDDVVYHAKDGGVAAVAGPEVKRCASYEVCSGVEGDTNGRCLLRDPASPPPEAPANMRGGPCDLSADACEDGTKCMAQGDANPRCVAACIVCLNYETCMPSRNNWLGVCVPNEEGQTGEDGNPLPVDPDLNNHEPKTRGGPCDPNTDGAQCELGQVCLKNLAGGGSCVARCTLSGCPTGSGCVDAQLKGVVARGICRLENDTSTDSEYRKLFTPCDDRVPCQEGLVCAYSSQDQTAGQCLLTCAP